jgi:hypothetical protein
MPFWRIAVPPDLRFRPAARAGRRVPRRGLQRALRSAPHVILLRCILAILVINLAGRNKGLYFVTPPRSASGRKTVPSSGLGRRGLRRRGAPPFAQRWRPTRRGAWLADCLEVPRGGDRRRRTQLDQACRGRRRRRGTLRAVATSGPGRRIHGDDGDARAGSAGRCSIAPSTTPLGWCPARCFPRNALSVDIGVGKTVGRMPRWRSLPFRPST